MLSIAVVLIAGIDQTTKDALKVQHILKIIERHPPRSDRKDRTAEVTEKELNAYIAHRLKQEQQSIFNGLTIALLENNHVSGTLKFDAQRLNLSVLLGEDLDFDFKGVFHTRNGAARLELIALQLGGQPVKPQVLEFVFHTASLFYGTEPGSLDDWYELPKGIKRIAIKKANARLYY